MKSLLFLLFAFSALSFHNLQTPTSFDEEARKKITHDILNNLVKENYEEVTKNFHSSLKTVLPVEKIAEVWKMVISSSGAYKKVISTTAGSFQGYNQIRIRCEFEKENATLEATFTEDDKVLGLFIKP